MKYERRQLKLDIPRYGLYVMGNESATGKTYLIKLLTKYMRDLKQEEGIPVYIFSSYTDYENIEVTFEIIANNSIILLDRLDYYWMREYRALLKSKMDSNYIFVDFKNISRLALTMFIAELSLGPGKLEVVSR